MLAVALILTESCRVCLSLEALGLLDLSVGALGLLDGRSEVVAALLSTVAVVSALNRRLPPLKIRFKCVATARPEAAHTIETFSFPALCNSAVVVIAGTVSWKDKAGRCKMPPLRLRLS